MQTIHKTDGLYMGKTGKANTVNYKKQTECENGRGNTFAIALYTIIAEFREE